MLLSMGCINNDESKQKLIGKEISNLEHVGELIFRAKVVNFSIKLGAKTGVMPSHNKDFRNDV